MTKTFTAAAVAAILPLAAMAQDGTDADVPRVVLQEQTQGFIDSLAGSDPLPSMSYEDARQVLIDTQTGADVDMADADVQEMTLDGDDGSFTIYTVRPAGSEGETLPGVVYFHGGGWILGNFTTHERLVRELANEANAAFVFVDYTAAPEAKHPTQLNQNFQTLQYVADNAGEFGIDPERLALAGDSVGGQMVAVVAQMAADNGGPELDALAFLYPVTTADLTSESYELFSDGPWLTKNMMEWMWEAYLPEGADTTDPMISPLNYGEEDLARLAPSLVITDANDVLRDEGEAFAAKLVQAGVEVEAARYDFTIHDFMMLNPITDTPAPRAAIEQTAGFLSDHLSE
ncbi:alpha/beta hydrolase [Salipiger sp. IMCC34102]|uniref:alpha/beta hydrolase n=1 Tax=Salipiger sp. IMCC34102 TaxID=2510647 RepID=UPI00101D6609|nr:alpha/beta hydrolase [Salipiger sp. IMCC34102]RYH03225.1 alpha/beta hydrolase [Salipiger sp. IMCC34102]